jgi:hypothetical protein
MRNRLWALGFAKGMFGTYLLQERIDKLVFLSQLREEVLALTKR